MTDLQILEQIEKQLNVKIERVEIDDSYYLSGELVYATNSTNEVVCLNIQNTVIKDLSLIGKLINLRKLELDNCQISDILPLKDLKQVSILWLSNNQIKDISPLKYLIQISELYLENNEIEDISPIKNLTQISSLWFGNNQINDITHLEKITKISDILLYDNQISDISSLKYLSKITILDLSNNHIKDISALKDLKKITHLYLTENEIKDISPIKDLKRIVDLTLDYNQINDISPVKLQLTNPNLEHALLFNPLKYPPIEIVELGTPAINGYFYQAEQGVSILQEAKLIIIGEAGAGKTTFARKIQNPDSEMPKPEETTLGVDIYNWDFDKGANEDKNEVFNARLWDFGGQDIYHGTHQFFFSDKSLYVLLADTREQKTDFNYWLNTVEQLTGADSPLIIVLNKKQKHQWQIDEPGLRARFGDIISKVITIDLSQSAEIPELQQIIKQQILNLPHIGYNLPTSWVEIRRKLSKLNDKFISFEKFRDICKDTGITNPKVVTIISKLFTNIGVFTHFYDEFSSLQDIIFLDSNWLTKTVYLLLNNEIVKSKQGQINLNEISEIWQADEIYFEKNKFIELLKRFSLIYRINGSENYIVPEYLPVVQPYNQWKYAKEANIYQFRYLFDNYMPKGIMPKLIVALHPYIYDNNLVWHRGVNITNSISNPDTFAEIIETYGRENRFDIRIYGKNQKDLLNIIIYHFDKLLKPFKKLTHEKLVPCNCDTCKTSAEPHFYNFEELNELKESDIFEIRCRKKPFLYAEINDLLNGINFTELRSVLINERFDEFEKLISQRFADISYQIQKEKITEGYFHGIFHTILAENGLNPVSEESTNDGRIDIHLTIGQTKYLFELKMNSTPEIALKQMQDKEYYRKYQRGFNKIVLVGVNFSKEKRNIDGVKYLKVNG